MKKWLLLLMLTAPLALMAQVYQSLPYEENFENPVSSTLLPTGWANYGIDTTTNGVFPKVVNGSSAAYGGSHYYRMEGDNRAVLVGAMPEFEDVSELMMDFYCHVHTFRMPTIFEVGVMEDTVFVPVDTVDFSSSSSNIYYPIRVFFSSYTGNGHRIAFRVTRTNSVGLFAVYIDDVVVSEAPACMYEPGEPLVTATTAHTATLTWGAADLSAGYGLILGDSIYSTTSTTYTFSGLDANVLYQGLLFNICPSGDTSRMSPFAFRTDCGVPTLPYTEDFEYVIDDMPACWFRPVTYTYVRYQYPRIVNGGRGGGGGHALSFEDGLQIAASPLLDAPAAELEVMGWVQSSVSYALEVGFLTGLDSNAVFYPVDTIIPTVWYRPFIVSFEGLPSLDSGHVAFRYNPSGYSQLLLDDVVIRRSSGCPMPTSFQMTTTRSGEVTLRWQGTSAGQWQVAYGPQGFDPNRASAASLVTTANDSVTIQGLDDSVVYEFFLRGVCDSVLSNWGLPVVVQPGVYPMSLYDTVTVRSCAARLTDEGGLAGNYSPRQTSYMVIYPETSGQMVSLHGTTNLYYSRTAAHTLAVYDGVGTDGPMLVEYTGHSQVVVTSTSGPLTLKLNSNNAGGGSYGAGFDLTVSCLTSADCPDPYDLTVTQVVGASALLSWSYWDGATPDFWTIEVVDTVTDSVRTYTAPGAVRSFLVGGLDQQTYYEVRLWASCLTGDTSGVGTTAFSTVCNSGGLAHVGNGATDMYIPIVTFSRYSYCQMIFRAGELNLRSDTIRGIRLYARDARNSRCSIDLYMGVTSLVTFDRVQDAIAMDSTQRVFSGSQTIGEGELEIMFDTPWVRPSASSNMVLTISSTTESYYGTTYWIGTEEPVVEVIHQDDSRYPVDPANPTSGPGGAALRRSYSRPNVTFVTGCDDARCVAPNASATVSENGVELNWVAGHDEGLWSVEYKRADDTAWTLSEASTSNTSATIVTLDPGTLYDFRVCGLCDDSTACTLVQARTACRLVTADQMPLMEDFEGFAAEYNSSETQPCWYRVYPNRGTSIFSPYIDSAQAHSGVSSLWFERVDGAALVLPQVGVPIDSLYLSFFTLTNLLENTPILEVGVMTNRLYLNSFVPVDTVRSGTAGSWFFQEVTFENYVGSGSYVAVRPMNDNVYLDDITMGINPSCRRVENIAVVANADNTATVTFDDPDSAGSYTVYWGRTDDVNAATDSIVCTASPVVIGNLTDAAFYYLWIRSNCSPQPSLWTHSQRFNSDCSVVEVTPTKSFTDDFEVDFLSCYSQECLSDTCRWEVMPYSSLYSSPAAGHGGYKVAYFRALGSTMLILPTFDFSALDHGAVLSFWHKGGIYYIEGAATDVYTRTSDTSEWQLMRSCPTPSFNWAEEVLTLPQSQNSPFYQIAFVGNEEMLLDDISVVSGRSCHRPDSLTVVPVDSTAVLAWVGNAAQYQIELENVDDGSLRLFTSTTHSVTFPGLVPLTNYKARVRGVCGVGDSSIWSEKIAFSTLACSHPGIFHSWSDELPQFENTIGPLGNGFSDYLYVQTLIDSANIAGLNGDISAMAFLSLDSQGGQQFTDVDIYMANVSEESLSDGFIRPNSDHVFVPVLRAADLTFDASGWHMFSLDSLFEWDGHSNILVSVVCRYEDSAICCAHFSNHRTNSCKTRYLYHDNAEFDIYRARGGVAREFVGDLLLVTCSGSCAPVDITGITFDNFSATLSWAASEPMTTYEVQLKPASATVWSAPVTVADTFYSATGLIPYTRYDFRVRQRCADSSGVSPWTMAGFTTTGVPCATPTNLSVSDTAATHATFTWLSHGLEGQWDLRVWNAEGFSTRRRVSTNPATIGGLHHNSTYQATIRSVCGDNGEQGDYGDTISFTTSYCPNVNGLTASPVSAFTVSLAWEDDTLVDGWTVEYGPGGFEQGFGTVVESTSNTCNIYGLEARTTYDFYVRAACGSEAWSRVSATTLKLPREQFTVEVLVNNANRGTVEGGGRYYDGQLAILTAIPNEGYQFGRWSDGTVDNPYRFVVTNDVTLVALFVDSQGISTVEDSASCTLSPNPADGTTVIDVRGLSGRVCIALMDMNGRKVYAQTVDSDGQLREIIDLHGLSQGAYFVTVTGNKACLVKKLVVR